MLEEPAICMESRRKSQIKCYLPGQGTQTIGIGIGQLRVDAMK